MAWRSVQENFEVSFGRCSLIQKPFEENYFPIKIALLVMVPRIQGEFPDKLSYLESFGKFQFELWALNSIKSKSHIYRFVYRFWLLSKKLSPFVMVANCCWHRAIHQIGLINLSGLKFVQWIMINPIRQTDFLSESDMPWCCPSDNVHRTIICKLRSLISYEWW